VAGGAGSAPPRPRRVTPGPAPGALEHLGGREALAAAGRDLVGSDGVEADGRVDALEAGDAVVDDQGDLLVAQVGQAGMRPL
jgi:hypothetical protein